jgi:hypothetical protein
LLRAVLNRYLQATLAHELQNLSAEQTNNGLVTFKSAPAKTISQYCAIINQHPA